MEILSIYSEEFKNYGKVLEGYDLEELLKEMDAIDLPESGSKYEASIEALEKLSIFKELENNAYGGMPIQLGMCWGRNKKLNCVEFHKSNEVNICSSDCVFFLGKFEDIENNTLDTSKIKAFAIPKGVVLDLYATTLHYTPCHLDENVGFRCVVVLPKGTNTPFTIDEIKNNQDKLLSKRNKWVIAHPDSPKAKAGAYVGLIGENLELN